MIRQPQFTPLCLHVMILSLITWSYTVIFPPGHLHSSVSRLGCIRGNESVLDSKWDLFFFKYDFYFALAEVLWWREGRTKKKKQSVLWNIGCHLYRLVFCPSSFCWKVFVCVHCPVPALCKWSLISSSSFRGCSNWGHIYVSERLQLKQSVGTVVWKNMRSDLRN